jgi:hypothetical protein
VVVRDPASDDQDELLDSSLVEPPTFEPERSSVLTPMGQVESVGSFARGLGARRVKWLIVVAGETALLLAILNLFA